MMILWMTFVEARVKNLKFLFIDLATWIVEVMPGPWVWDSAYPKFAIEKITYFSSPASSIVRVQNPTL